MKKAQSEKVVSEPPAEAGVAAYLESDPAFFERHPDVLEALSLPHHAGPAVSLIERQVQVLRSRNHQLQQRLGVLMETARKNEARVLHMNRLAARLIAARTAQETVDGITESIRAEFDVEYVAVLLRAHAATAPTVVDGLCLIREGDSLDTVLTDFFRMGKTECGPLDEPLTSALWPQASPPPRSAALVPLDRTNQLGALVLASYELHRFTPDMGTWFLEQVAALVAVACRARLGAGAGDGA